MSIKLATITKPQIALHRAIISPIKNVQVQNDGANNFAQPPQHSPKPINEKKRVKKNLELNNVSQEDPKHIEEELQEEGEEGKLTRSSSKGKSNKELPND